MQTLQSSSERKNDMNREATLPKTFAKLLREHKASEPGAQITVNLHQYHDGRWAIFGHRTYRNHEKDALKMICITDGEANMRTWANASAAISQAKHAAKEAEATHGHNTVVEIELTIDTEDRI